MGDSYDAVIVGAGPGGSATAALLAQRGLSVLLLDRAAFPRDKACGEYTSPETEAVLGRIGALPAVEAAGARRLTQMHLISPSGSRFALDYFGATGGAKTVLATRRRALDAALVDHARASGAEVRERVRVEAVTMRNGQAAGVVLAGKHKATEIAARLVIGADGVHSIVARSMGVVAPLRWPRSLGMVAHYSGYNGLDGWGEMHVSRNGYAGLAPLSNGVLNVGLVMPLSRAGDWAGGGAVERFKRFANSFPGVAERLRGAERISEVRGVGPVGSRAKRAYGAGYLLVGDAAGFFDPFTGEGVYKALRSAEMAAGIAADALEHNDMSARSLSRYGAQRRREFASKDLFCRLVQLFVGLPPVMDYATTRLARRANVGQVLTGVLGDYTDPRRALSPAYLWSLLRP